MYDHPFLWGSRRIGPDLGREGGKYNNLWHLNHLQDPRSVTPKSIMPAYPGLLTNTIDFPAIEKHVRGMAMLGVPYGDVATTDGKAIADAHAQAKSIADDIAANRGPAGLEDKEIVALVAYLQRLGTDIKKAGSVAQRNPLLGGL